MKISLALGKREPLNRQTAWGCLTANLALPGCGSLVAGRISGYGQLAFAAAGLMLTVTFGTRFIFWYLANWSQLQQPSDMDPFGTMSEIWLHVRWALAGIAVFSAGWLWALGTSLHLLRQAKSPPVMTAPGPR